MKLRNKLIILPAFLALAIPLVFLFTGNAMAETAGCMVCHGNPTLQKTIVVSGGTETLPLYVNLALYNANAHGAKDCTDCHTDIDISPGSNHGTVAGRVAKTYGGWARFSKGVATESIAAGTEEATRNYYSPAVAASCPTCHTAHVDDPDTSAHKTIYKLRGAHIDTALTACAGKTVGENYEAGNCNRCHAGCQSCHFDSVVTAKNANNILEYWEQVQTCDKTDSGCTTSPPDSMSEFYMDRTLNIASHNFRNKAALQADAAGQGKGVCEACHTGYYRPTTDGWYWNGVPDPVTCTTATSVIAANVRRHPQAYELWISGSEVLSLPYLAPTPIIGGTNTAHAAMECADCHGTGTNYGAAGDVHSLPGTTPGTDEPWATRGDVQCTDCHDSSAVHTTPSVARHLDATGIKVACTGCHTFGMGRDFELAKYGTSTAHDVFIDPETNEVRPVARKNGHAIAWYSHNWQTLTPADCAKKCHFAGNVAGASADDFGTGSAGCMGTSGCHGDSTLEKTIVVSGGGMETVPLYVDLAVYNNSTTHGTVECSSCHTDIDISPGSNHGTVAGRVLKTYGGWARFSKGVATESIAAGTEEATRNYYSPAVAASCPTCHTAHVDDPDTSAHATIYKLRGAHIDAALTACAGKTVGENYEAGNCNRCHAGCQSCHFDSVVTAKNANNILEYWEQVQTNDTIDGSTSPSDSMSEFYMDRTPNIVSHNFRKKAALQADAAGQGKGVCEACHTGYYRPTTDGWYWNGDNSTCDNAVSVKAANVRRHPQAYELWISGSDVLDLPYNASSPITAGSNAAHAAMECADCHGTGTNYGAAGDVHSLPGTDTTTPGTDEPWATRGDVQCTDCHDSSAVHSSTPSVARHMDAIGIKVACTGCHTFGMGRDFELAKYGPSTTTAHDVFIDPETNEVRPVARKNGHAIAWYSHNWQTMTPADCANKCHYAGNVVNAPDNLENLMGYDFHAGAPNAPTCTDCHSATPTGSDWSADVLPNCVACHASGGAATTQMLESELKFFAYSYHKGKHGAVSEGDDADPGNSDSVNARFNWYQGDACYKVNLDGDMNDSATCNWSAGSLTASGCVTSMTFSGPGRYEVTLTTDTGKRTMVVTATGNSLVPDTNMALVQGGATGMDAGVTDASDGKSCDATDNGTAIVLWGDGSTTIASIPENAFIGTHTYGHPGTYTVRYSYRDSNGNKSMAKQETITVPYGPTNITVSGTITTPGGGTCTIPTYDNQEDCIRDGYCKYGADGDDDGYPDASPAACAYDWIVIQNPGEWTVSDPVPVENVTVYVKQGNTIVKIVKTGYDADQDGDIEGDEKGMYTVEVPAGTYTLDPVKTGYSFTPDKPSVSSDSTLNFTATNDMP